MATVVEILELSGVPTLCASKATREEAHLKVGEVIAKALQVLPTPVTILQLLENPVLSWGLYIYIFLGLFLSSSALAWGCGVPGLRQITAVVSARCRYWSPCQELTLMPQHVDSPYASEAPKGRWHHKGVASLPSWRGCLLMVPQPCRGSPALPTAALHPCICALLCRVCLTFLIVWAIGLFFFFFFFSYACTPGDQVCTGSVLLPTP